VFVHPEHRAGLFGLVSVRADKPSEKKFFSLEEKYSVSEE